MNYDGTTPLSEALAELYGISPKSSSSLSAKVNKAKKALRIKTKTRVLPPKINLKIYRWHYEQLNHVQDVKQVDEIELQADSYVQDIKQSDPVQNVKQCDDESVLRSDILVQDVKQNDSQAGNDFKQIFFALTIESRRTSIMLEGYLVNAIQRKLGLSNNTAIRIWLQQAIANDSRFDPSEAITKQVKRLIMEAIV